MTTWNRSTSKTAYDLVGISVMLTCQLPRAFQIAQQFRKRGVPVIFGGIATMLHSEEVAGHADPSFLVRRKGALAASLPTSMPAG